MTLIGAKCHICQHLSGSTHDVAPAWPVVRSLRCEECAFCQEEALADIIQHAGLGIFDPEVRRAVHAFQRGETDPLLEKLRTELQGGDVA